MKASLVSLLVAVPVASASPVFGQSAPLITYVDGEIELSWEAFADAYEIQVSESLAPGDWHPRVFTEHETARVRLSGGDRYLRVARSSTSRTAIPDARRLQILDQIGVRITQVSADIPRLQQCTELAAFLSNYPELEAIGVHANASVYARFLDGRLLAIINNRRPATTEELNRRIDVNALPAPDEQPQAEFRGRTRRSNHFVVGMPESRRAILLKAQGMNLMADMIGLLRPAFEDGGYQVITGDATLDNYLAIGDVERPGVVYIDSHSSEIPIGYSDRDPVTGNQHVFGQPTLMLATSTQVSPELEGRVRSWFDAGDIAYAYLGPEVSGSREVFYAILPNFVRKNWRLGKNSLVYLDTCESGSIGSTPFREACFAVGAAGYAGWSEAVLDYWGFVGTTRHVADLLIGRSLLLNDRPRQRPFGISETLDALHSRGLLDDPDGARLLYSEGPNSNGSFRLLCPSIVRMEAMESLDQILVQGMFDPDAPAVARVEFDRISKEVQAEDVRAGSLTFSLPGGDTPSVGDVTIIQNGRRGNTVPLSEWKIMGTLLKQPAGELTATTKVELRFRADVHSFRARPFEQPAFRGAGASIAKGSTGRLVDAGGTHVQRDGRSSVRWSLDKPFEIPFANLRGMLSIEPDGLASVFAAARTGSVMTVQHFLDGMLTNSFLSEGGTGAAPGGTPTVMDFATFGLAPASHVGAGDFGMFSIEGTAPVNPPTGDFAR